MAASATVACLLALMLHCVLANGEAVRSSSAKLSQRDSLKQVQWRRTRHGWEPLRGLQVHRPQLEQSLASEIHPLVVGGLILLLSLGALLAFEEPSPETHRGLAPKQRPLVDS